MAQQAARVERSSDRWLSLILSVVLHGALFAAIGYTWWTYKNDHPQPTLAIEATVVDAKVVAGIDKLPPQPEAPPPPLQPTPDSQPQVEPEGPPQPTPEELARREQEQQAEREAQAKQAEQAKQLELDRQREEQERQQEQALAEEKAAQEKRDAAEKKAAQEKAEAERKEAERKAAEAKKREEDKRLAEQQKAESQANAEREADLRRSLNDEIRQDQLLNSGAMANWQSQITALIRSKWQQPPTARPGIVCVLDVTQTPGGTVTNVQLKSCNGDAAVRDSIETAAYKASPLPPPPDPSLFQRELLITFRPN